MKYICGLNSNKGARSSNQDTSLLEVIHDKKGEEILLAVICDGMGGMDRGEYASQTMTEIFSEWIDSLADCDDFFQAVPDIRGELNTLVDKGNGYLYSYGKQNGIMLGTTCSALLILRDSYVLIHVGDSRFYRIRKETVTQLTKDHSVVAQEVEEGRLTREEARHDPRRNRLLRCVGGRPSVQADIYCGQVLENDVFFFGSDGLFHELYDEEFRRHLSPDNMKTTKKIQKSLDALTGIAMERGERDNITVGAFEIVVDGGEGFPVIGYFRKLWKSLCSRRSAEKQTEKSGILQKIYLKDGDSIYE